MTVMSTTKFTAKTGVEVYKALQKYGKLSYEKLAEKTALPKTTIQYAYERLQKRDFFEVIAVPKLEKFPELPFAFIGFDDVHPIRLQKLKETYADTKEVRAFITNNDKVLMILMGESKDRVAELIFEIMEMAQAKIMLHMLSPMIDKFDLTIPDEIIDTLYNGGLKKAKQKK